MKLEDLHSLGERVRKEYAAVNFNPDKFDDIAERALTNLTSLVEVSLNDIARFLCTTNIRQNPDSRFGNLPIVVYGCSEFYIEILVWTDSTTQIHEHSFCGAFRVLIGSSLHSRYRLTRKAPSARASCSERFDAKIQKFSGRVAFGRSIQEGMAWSILSITWILPRPL